MAKRRFHSVNRPIPTRQVLFLALDKQKSMNKSVYDCPLSAVVLEWPENMGVPKNEDDFKNYLQSIKFRFVNEFREDDKSHEASNATERKDLMSYLMEGLAGGVFQQRSNSDDDDDYDGFITLAKLCNYVDDRIRQNQLQEIKFCLPHDYDPTSKILNIDPERITTSIVKQVEDFYNILLQPTEAYSLIMAAGKIRKLKSRKDVGIDWDLIQMLEHDFRNVLTYRYANLISTWLKEHKDRELRAGIRDRFNQTNDRQLQQALRQLSAFLNNNLDDLLKKDLADLLKLEAAPNLKKNFVANSTVEDLEVIKKRTSFQFFSQIWLAINDSRDKIDGQVDRIITDYYISYQESMGKGQDVLSDKNPFGASLQ